MPVKTKAAPDETSIQRTPCIAKSGAQPRSPIISANRTIDVEFLHGAEVLPLAVVADCADSVVGCSTSLSERGDNDVARSGDESGAGLGTQTPALQPGHAPSAPASAESASMCCPQWGHSNLKVMVAAFDQDQEGQCSNSCLFPILPLLVVFSVSAKTTLALAVNAALTKQETAQLRFMVVTAICPGEFGKVP